MQVKTKLTVASVAVSLLFLSIQAWSTHSPTNIYNHATDPRLEDLELRAQEMRSRLEYMVFKQERQSSQKLLADALRARVAIQPWSAQNWSDLLFAITEVPVSIIERDWVFAMTVKMQRWNQFQRISLANRCVRHRSNSSPQWRQLCQELLSHLPAEVKAGRLLRIMDVKQAELDAAMPLYQVPFSQDRAAQKTQE